MTPAPPLQQSGIGVVAPYDFALDRELWRWVPDDVSLHITRMPYAPLPATLEMAVHISDPALVAKGVIDVRAVGPLVAAYACTSGSFIGGVAGEAALVSAMTGAGAPSAITTSGALLSALRHFGADRIATVTPYVAELTAGLTTFLAEAGVEVVRPAVSSATYGVTLAMRPAPRWRSAASNAPLVVIAAGAPAPVIADTSAASPATPPMKLPDVQA